MPPTQNRRVTPEGQAAAARIAENRRLRDSGMTATEARQTMRAGTPAPAVSATALTQPVTPVTVPEPRTAGAPINVTPAVSAVAQSTNNIIEAQTAEAAELKRLRQEQSLLMGEESLSNVLTREQERLGLPDNLKALQDIQLQLADRATESAITQTRIAGAAGQTLAQGQREITQEQREEAVRSAGLAARASVLQGNVETATQLANQAVSIAYQDRMLRNDNLINQINSLQGVVDNQTAQLLEKDRRKYEEDQRSIMRAQSAVDTAVSSGFATQRDIEKMMSFNGDPEMQAQYALGIVANAAREAAYFDRIAKEASAANADLARRQTLYELAALGDPAAIAELGWNPNDGVTEEQSKIIDKQIEDINNKMLQATEAISNKIGLQASSGEWQFGEATIRGFVPRGPVFEGGQVVQSPEYGGITGSVRARQQKSVFLTNVDNLITQEGLQEIGRLAEQGIKLTPITERELSILFNSASVLNTAAIRDKETGKLKGFSIPDYQVEEEISQYMLSLSNIKAELQADTALPRGTYGELQELQNQVLANPQ